MNHGPPSGGWSAPLQRWRVRNFKSIEEADLELCPLTLLVGANSSGKTSFLQSLLLVVQAAQGGAEGPALPLNGPLVAAGRFEDARSAGAKGPMGLGGTLRSERGIFWWSDRRRGLGPSRRRTARETGPTIDWWAEFDAPAPDAGPGTADLRALEFGAERSDEDADDRIRLKAERRGSGELEEDRMRLRLGLLTAPVREEFRTGFTGRFEGGDGSLPVRGLYLRGGLPHGFLTTRQLGEVAAITWVEIRGVRPFWAAPLGIGVGTGTGTPEPRRPAGRRDTGRLDQLAARAVDEISRWEAEKDQGVDLPSFLSAMREPLSVGERMLLREYREEAVRAIAERLAMPEEVYLPPDRLLAQRLFDAASAVHSFLRERVVYLGPLRQDPQVIYKTAPAAMAGFIGTKGEYTAAVLHTFRSRQVDGFDEHGEPEFEPLAEAVSRWARRLEIADEVQTTDLARLGIQISVRRGSIGPIDITGVGVGVSQLLPVVVMCLTAEPGSLILLEQPELHLHPALQQRLADFLLACARSGRQLVVETHSEYMVSRLRRRIAEDETDELVRNVALYFVEQVDDRSRFRRVPVNEYGAVEEWPTGFFDQAATDSHALLEAGLAKRARRGDLD